MNPRIKLPGLTAGNERFSLLLNKLCILLKFQKLKARINETTCVVFLGGTGTGKSTVFNYMCGSQISVTGVERPETKGVIMAVPAGKDELLSDLPWVRVYKGDLPFAGDSSYFSIVLQSSNYFPDYVFIDTPDLDSVVDHHRTVVENIFYLADIVVYVLSEEKYADLKLIAYLSDFVKEHECVIVLVNKVHHEELITKDINLLLSSHGIRDFLKDVEIIPFGEYSCSRNLNKIAKRLLELGNRKCSNAQNRLKNKVQFLEAELKQIISSELEELIKIKAKINEISDKVFQQMIEAHSSGISKHAGMIIQERVKKVYAKYDVLSRPRRFIRSIVSFPLKIFGFHTSDGETNGEALQKNDILAHFDFSIVADATYSLVKSVLEIVENYPDSELIVRFKQERLVLSENEMKELVAAGLKDLFSWLKGEFSKLQEGIPKLKEFGIYSTALVWAVFILSIEAAIGGGISIFDALLSSALAPFISKGAVELFARQDVRRVVKELIKRHHENLRSVINVQRDRFLKVLQDYEKALTELEHPSELCEHEQLLVT